MKRSIIKWSAPAIALGAMFLLGHEQTETAEAFLLHGDSWNTNDVNYTVNASFTDPGVGDAAEQTAAIQRAANEWTSAGQTPFQFHYAGPTTQTLVAPTDGENAIFYSEVDGGGALATCTWAAFANGDFFGFDIQFFTSGGGMDFVWSNDPAFNEFDLESVAVHEFGHACGLGHSVVAGATMFATVTAGSTINRTLHPDDIAGIQALYGVQPTGSPTISNITPESGWIGGGTRVTVTGNNFSGQDPQTVLVDGIAATEVTVIDQNTMSFVAPQGVRSGFVSVSYSHNQGNVDGGDIYFNESTRLLSPLQIDNTSTIELFYPDDPNLAFRAAPALGFLEGLPVSQFGDPTDPRVIPINTDVLFQDQQDGLLDGIFVNFTGTLDGSGQGFMNVSLPNEPFLSGYALVMTSITIDPAFLSTIKNISNAEAGIIQ